MCPYGDLPWPLPLVIPASALVIPASVSVASTTSIEAPRPAVQLPAAVVTGREPAVHGTRLPPLAPRRRPEERGGGGDASMGMDDLASAFHGGVGMVFSRLRKEPSEQGECGCLRVASPAQGGHLAGAGYQVASWVRSRH